MNRIRAIVAALLTATLGLGLSPAPALADEQRRGPVECAATLDCTAAEIDQMSMGERLTFVRAMSSGPAARLLPGYIPRWRNIEGIITFFRDRGMGAPGTWVSYVDAGIVEGIERGIALALGRDGGSFGNPGSALWADYLTGLRDGLLRARSAHDRAWSLAEQASTEHGVTLAEQVHGIAPTSVEQRFFAYSEFYRWVMRNRPAALDLVAAPVGPGEQPQLTFHDWFTDVGNSTPSYRGAVLAYDLAEFDVPGGSLNLVALLHAYARELGDDYLADTSARQTS